MIVLIFEDKPFKAKEKKENAKPEKKVELPKYIVPVSNFSDYGDKHDIGLLGIPCMVISKEPHLEEHKTLWGKVKVDVIEVVSLVTGIKYTVPNDYYKGYNTSDGAFAASRVSELEESFMLKEIIGKEYYPKDNSYIIDMEDPTKSYTNLIGKECKIISLPFVARNEYYRECEFVLVECEGKVYRTLFSEWCLYK